MTTVLAPVLCHIVYILAVLNIDSTLMHTDYQGCPEDIIHAYKWTRYEVIPCKIKSFMASFLNEPPGSSETIYQSLITISEHCLSIRNKWPNFLSSKYRIKHLHSILACQRMHIHTHGCAGWPYLARESGVYTWGMKHSNHIRLWYNHAFTFWALLCLHLPNYAV